MNLKALKRAFPSLNVNPDEIEDEIYAAAFRILLSIIEMQNETIEALKAKNLDLSQCLVTGTSKRFNRHSIKNSLRQDCR